MTHVGVTTKCHWWVLLDENWGDDRKSIISISPTHSSPWMFFSCQRLVHCINTLVVKVIELAFMLCPPTPSV